MLKTLYQYITIFLLTTLTVSTGTAANSPRKDINTRRSSTATVRSSMQIRLLPENNASLARIAREFADIIGKMSGRNCEIRKSPFNQQGILLALTSAYRGKLKLPEKFASNPERFLIHSEPGKSLVIIGNSEKAIENGVYTYLQKLGCRWFFPGKRWTIIPQRKNLLIKLDLVEAPDYRNRNIWYQYGCGWGNQWNSKKIAADYQQWRRANRQGGIASFNCGHSWGSIVRRNREKFKKHPEYYAMDKNGKRPVPKNPNTAKFCCSNPGLIKLVAEDRWRLLQEKRKHNPNEFMVSVDPSDGPHMCYCENCRKLGSGKASDQVVNLADGVADFLRKYDPRAWAGFYAYSAHQDPPTLDIAKNVYVQMAMAFNNSKYTLDELLTIWGKKAGAIGIREYYSVTAWDWQLPGRARGGNISYHCKTIPRWHKLGMTSISAESTNAWAPYGPGYYVAANLMWNTETDANQLLDDFYHKAFGNAATPIRELYRQWQNAPPLLPGYLAHWLEKLDQAAKLAKSPETTARINDLKAYAHYLVLYRDFQNATKGNDARKKYLKLLEFVFRIKSRNMVHSYALARRVANGKFPDSILYDLPQKLQGGNKKIIAKWNIFKPAECPWQQNKQEYSDEEIEHFFADDLKRFLPATNSIKSFSDKLIVPPQKLQGADDGSSRGNSYRFKNRFYLLCDKKSLPIELSGNRASNLSLYKQNSDQVLQQAIIHRGENRKIILKIPEPGLYRLEVSGWFTIKFPANLKVVYTMSPSTHGQPTPYAGPAYFYVPGKTRKFSMAIGTRLILKAPNGKTWTFLAEKSKSPVTITVPPGCDGKRWEICWLSCGEWFFLDIPPYVSLSPNGYIGPEECFLKEP